MLRRFKGLVDEETLKLLSLYGRKVKIKARVENLRIFGDKATLDFINQDLGIRFKTILDINFPELCKLGKGGIAILEGKFSGDCLKLEKIKILQKSTKKFKGTVVAVEDKLFILSNSNCCLSCIYDSSISEGTLISVSGAVSDSGVVVVEKMCKFSELGGSVNFTPLFEIANFEGRVCVKGRISGIGESGKWYSVYLSDENGRIKMLMCRKFYEFYRRVDIGDYVEVFGCLSKGGVLYCDFFTIIRS